VRERPQGPGLLLAMRHTGVRVDRTGILNQILIPGAADRLGRYLLYIKQEHGQDEMCVHHHHIALLRIRR
jgi:hypothetical protein